MDNVKSTAAYDEYGEVTSEVGDAGVTDVITDHAHDLAGNTTVDKEYTDGTSNARTTTTYYGAAGRVVGTSGPIVPTAGSAPDCPGVTPAVKCNTVTVPDMNGRASTVTDAYGKVTVT